MQPRVQHSEIVASACLVVASRAAPPAVSARGVGGWLAAAPGARVDQAIECAAPIASQLMVVFVVGLVDVGGVSAVPIGAGDHGVVRCSCATRALALLAIAVHLCWLLGPDREQWSTNFREGGRASAPLLLR